MKHKEAEEAVPEEASEEAAAEETKEASEEAAKAETKKASEEAAEETMKEASEEATAAAEETDQVLPLSSGEEQRQGADGLYRCSAGR